jgi:uncharacterized membrane protein YadS
MVFYPALLSLFELSDVQAGYIVGASLHDVAQVVGAGYVISETAGDSATLTKLLRVAMLVPTTLILSIAVARFALAGQAGTPGKAPIRIPAFLIGFVVLAVAANLSLLPGAVLEAATTGSRWCLMVAIAALGVKTVLKDFVALGWRPLALMIAETLFIAGIVATAVILGGGWVLPA